MPAGSNRYCTWSGERAWTYVHIFIFGTNQTYHNTFSLPHYCANQIVCVLTLATSVGEQIDRHYEHNHTTRAGYSL